MFAPDIGIWANNIFLVLTFFPWSMNACYGADILVLLA